MKEKRLSSLKSCLSLLGDAGWFPELDAVLKKRERGEKDRVGGRKQRRGDHLVKDPLIPPTSQGAPLMVITSLCTQSVSRWSWGTFCGSNLCCWWAARLPPGSPCLSPHPQTAGGGSQESRGLRTEQPVLQDRHRCGGSTEWCLQVWPSRGCFAVIPNRTEWCPQRNSSWNPWNTAFAF